MKENISVTDSFILRKKNYIFLSLKKSIILIIIVAGSLLSFNASAQFTKVPNLPKYDLAPYHFGFYLAVNQMFFTINPIDNLQNVRWETRKIPDFFADSAYILSLEGRYTYGFTIGIVSNLRVSKFLDLRFLPNLAFGERELIYEIKSYWKAESIDDFTTFEELKRIYSTYINFPLHMKYKSKRLHNMRAYILGGVNYRIDLASEAKKNQDELDNKHVKIKRNDLAFEGGVGFDFYTTYFKFGMEVKMSYSPINIVIDEDNLYTDAIDKLTSKLFTFSFTFE